MKTIVAFLQNMWVRDPDRVRSDIAKYGEQHRLRLIQYCLFAGCLTGRRLKTAFGDELLEQIIWEESTREIAGNSRHVFPPDFVHIQAVLAEIKPRVVIAFGRIAGDAVKKVWNGPLVCCSHPAARQADTVGRLHTASVELKTFLNPAILHEFNSPKKNP
jgi:hypothetical protein